MESIEQASFVSFDFEFTGFETELSSKPNPFDTLDQRYKKIKHSVEHFEAIELGLSCFI